MKMRRTVAVAGAAGLMAVATAACQPYFDPDTGSLTATQLGQLAQLTWTPATEEDEGQVVDHYAIEVNGVEVTTFPAASGTSCVLTGLATGGSYTLSVTAYDNMGEYSGDYTGGGASLARVSTPYTNGTIGASAGSSPTCVAPTDSDADRLPDALENNNGTFLNATATGTNPNIADTDADGIKDGDEVLGSAAGLNLYGMGTRPVKKDLLFEYDWFDDNAEPLTCGAHSHRPTAAVASRVSTAFAGLSTTNPDGTTGVNVIHDYGQGGLFTGGTLLADADGMITGGVNDAEFNNYKNANFAANREGYFHYTLLPHQYGGGYSSGQAELPGDDLIVSLYCYGTTDNVGNTIMHEVGHNLNLRHGGFENTNNKPNYNSVMNYDYQFPGIDTTCDAVGDGVLSYSNGTRITIDEFNVFEANGVCGPGFPIDWNGGGISAAPLALDLNGDTFGSTLQDYNDQVNMCLTCVTSDGADGARVSAPEIITEQEVPDSAR